MKQKLIDFLCNDPKSLQEIYSEFTDESKTTIRGRLNENIGTAFKRIARGVYLSINGDTKALIIEGDSWSILRKFDDESIDAVITDSGYTCLNHHYEKGSTRKRNRLKGIGFKTKDIDKELLSEMFRVMKPGAHFFSFLPADAKDTLEYNDHIISLARQCGFQFNKRFIWDKVHIGMGYNGRNRYEQILFLSKGKRRMPQDLGVPDVLRFPRVAASKRTHHAEKPVELIEAIMKFATKEGEVVLDPFAGSMSAAKAGLRCRRHTISIEYDADIVASSLKDMNFFAKRQTLNTFMDY